jgi:hypothetical protein
MSGDALSRAYGDQSEGDPENWPVRVPRALFVFDRDNWCSVFHAPGEAAAELEANDVEADVHLATTPEHDEDQLRARLRRFVDQWQIVAPTHDLIDIGNAVLPDEWNGRRPRRPRRLARRLHGTSPPTL